MDEFLIVSTINNLKNTRLCKENKGSSIEIEENGKRIIIHKGQYAVFSIKFKLLAIVSSDFFKTYFQVVGRMFLKYTTKDFQEHTMIVGVLCSMNILSDKIQEDI